MKTANLEPLTSAKSDMRVLSTHRVPGRGWHLECLAPLLVIATMMVWGQINPLFAGASVTITVNGVDYWSGSIQQKPHAKSCDEIYVSYSGGGCCTKVGFDVTNDIVEPWAVKPVSDSYEFGYGGWSETKTFQVYLDPTSKKEPPASLTVSFGVTATDTCMPFVASDANTLILDSDCGCSANGKPATSTCKAAVGSLDFRLFLGPAYWWGDAGYFWLYADTSSTNLSTPAALRPPYPQPNVLVITNASGTIEQVLTPLVLANVSVVNIYEYNVQFFSATNITGMTNGLYVTSGTPFDTWVVQNPDTNAACNRLRITEQGATNQQFQYTYSAGTNGQVGRWDLLEPDGQTTLSAWKVPNPNDVSITNYYSQTSSGTNILKLTCAAKKFVAPFNGVPANGLLTLTNIEGFGAVTQTTVYTYYPTNAATGSANLLRRVDNPDGSWQYYIYNDLGLVVTNYSTLNNNPPPSDVTTQPNPLTDLCRETDYQYDTQGIHPFTVTNTTVREPAGEQMRVVSSLYHEDLSSSDGRSAGSRTGYNIQPDDPNNPGTITRYYTINDDTNYAGNVKSVSHADGTASVYAYTLTSSTFTTVEYAGECDSYWGSAAMTSGNIQDGTKTTTVKDLFGRTLTDTVQDIVSQVVLSQKVYTYSPTDPRGQDYSVVDLAGRTSQYQYACCGLESTTDPDGVLTAYAYDSMKRPYKTTVFRGSSYIQIVKTFDGLGRVVGTTIIGTNGSAITVDGYQYDALGRVLRQTNALGGATTVAYGVMNSQVCITNTYPDGGTRIEIYQRDGRLQSVIGTAVSPVGYQYGLEQDTDNSWWAYTLEIKLSATWSTNEWVKTYTDAGRKTYKTIYPSATTNVVSVNYYSGGLLTNQIDPDGVSIIYNYDDPSWAMSGAYYKNPGRQRLTVVDMNRDGAIDFSGNDRITQVSQDVTYDNGFNVSRTQTYMWNTSGSDSSKLVSTRDTSTDGLRSWSTVWNNGAAVTSRSVTSYGANNCRYETNTAPDNSCSVSTYQYGQLVSVNNFDSGNNQIGGTTYGYDAFGRQNKMTDARNGTTTVGYNAAGLVATNTTPNPGGGTPETTITTYNNVGQAVMVTQPDNTTVSSEYLPTGQLRLQYGARIYPVLYTYDAQGRVLTMTNWSNYGGGTGTRGTTWNYDIYRGFLASKTYDGNSAGPSYAYTAAGRLASRVWARGITTTYKYDCAGGLTNVVYSDGATPNVTCVYDRLGRQTNATWNGITETLAYNDANELLSESYSGGVLHGLSVTNGYDADLRRTALSALTNATPLLQQSFGYDAASRLQTVSDGTNNATYSYVANSPLVSQITFKSNSVTRMTTIKQYDYLNRLTLISNAPSSGLPVSHNYAYNAANQRTQDTLMDGSDWVYQYDSLGQVTSGKKYWADGTLVAGQQFGYAFDDIGNRTQTQSGGDPTGANLRTASYYANNLNQLTNRDIPPYVDVKGVSIGTNVVTVNGQTAYRKGEYFRDELPVNNTNSALWSNIVVTATGQTSVTGNVYVAQTPEHFSYDPDGNLTNDGRFDYIWDGENRLVGMTNNTGVGPRYGLTFAYDPQGRRIQKLVATNGVPAYTNRFLYNGWNLIATLTPNSQLQSAFMWGLDLSGSMQGAGGVGGLLEVSYKGTSITNSFPAIDGNGNVATLVNATDGTVMANYEYGPFGELTRATGPMAKTNPVRFSTKYQDDESDLLYYGYRYYKPSTGTWPTRDPIEEKGGLNLYGYDLGDPINHIDALGLADIWRVVRYSPINVDDWYLSGQGRGGVVWLGHWYWNIQGHTDSDGVTTSAWAFYSNFSNDKATAHAYVFFGCDSDGNIIATDANGGGLMQDGWVSAAAYVSYTLSGREAAVSYSSAAAYSSGITVSGGAERGVLLGIAGGNGPKGQARNGQANFRCICIKK
jgi:RHS repeat-associated protein